MKHRLSYTLRLIFLGMTSIASNPAGADTVAAGPYYATPSWDQTLPASTRFVVLSNFGGNAVLDRSTGLVWEKSPNNTSATQYNALKICLDSTLGGQGGWRLPSIHELTSLIDADNTNPSLPTGHPFVNVHHGSNEWYWSATTYGIDAPEFGGEAGGQFAWEVEFQGFLNIPTIFTGRVLHESKDLGRLVWCVRGGGPMPLY